MRAQRRLKVLQSATLKVESEDLAVEREMTACNYRVRLLEKLTSEPINYTFMNTNRGKKPSSVHIDPLKGILTDTDVKTLKEVMVDMEMFHWQQAGAITGLKAKSNQHLQGKKRKRSNNTKTNNDKDMLDRNKFRRSRDGIWSTATNTLQLQTRQTQSSSPDNAALSSNKEISSASIVGGNDSKEDSASNYYQQGDVSCTDFNSTQLDADISLLDHSFAEDCEICKNHNETSVECAARLCRRTICEKCWLQQENNCLPRDEFTENYTKIELHWIYYCCQCKPQVADWITTADSLTEAEVQQLRMTEMCISNNTEANIWHFYIQKTLKKLTFLPPSLHPRFVLSCAKKNRHHWLLDIPEEKRNLIPFLTTHDLKDKLQDVHRQFALLQPHVEYSNSPTAVSLAKVSGHDTSTIHNTLTPNQKDTLHYVLERADNYSRGKIVRQKRQYPFAGSDVCSVVGQTFCPKGTIVLEYVAMHKIGGQMLGIATAETSRVWTVLEHKDESKSVYIDPGEYANLGPYINGTRCQDQRMANLVALKVRDKDGLVRVCFVAVHDIEPGEHYLYYYGDTYGTEGFCSVASLANIAWEDF